MASRGHPTLPDLLAGLAAPTPAPGGGTACAIACGLAAALAEMTGGEDGGRARARALELAEADPVAYAGVLEAYRGDGDGDGDGEERAQRIARALSAAADPPLAMAETAAGVAEAAADRVAVGRPSMRGDALAGVLLAEAVTVAAARLVEIDLADAGDDPRIARARSCADRAGKARQAALAAAIP